MDIIKTRLNVGIVKTLFETKYIIDSKINIGIISLNIYLFVVFCILLNLIY